MSYTALYRKYRPVTFEEVSGQDHVTVTLRNQIRADRVGHAYLLTGSRGTGKTSVAKIFARAVNCEHPRDGSPCNECASCRSILADSSMNVIEIDAASNNGVDNIRQIREEVAYPPTEGRKKVYIIDEVHMLSPGAFNALLKTLEEPPAYVIFILATTEVHKIPVTILSRCQRYDFRRLSREEITQRLQELMQKENVDAEPGALQYIARKADGGMRDALSLADQCISFYLGQKLTYQRVLDVLGAVDTQVVGSIFRACMNADVASAMAQLEDLIYKGRDITQFTADFTEYLRNLLVLRTLEDHTESAQLLGVSEENLALLEEEAAMTDENQLMRYIRIFSELAAQMRTAANRRILTEVALIKLCRPQMEEDLSSLADRIRALEKMMENGFVPAASAGGRTVSAGAGRKAPEEQEAPAKVVYQKAPPQALQQIKDQWPSILAGLDEGLFKRTILKPEFKYDASGETEDVLFLVSQQVTAEECAADKEMLQHLEELIEDTIGSRIRVRILSNTHEDAHNARLRPVEVMQQARAAIHHMIETVPDAQTPEL